MPGGGDIGGGSSAFLDFTVTDGGGNVTQHVHVTDPQPQTNTTDSINIELLVDAGKFTKGTVITVPLMKGKCVHIRWP